jgi:hypothetical protein
LTDVLWVVIRRETEAYDAAASLVCDHHLPDLVAWKRRSIRPDDFGGRRDGLLARLGVTGEDRSVLILNVLAVANIEEVERHRAPSFSGGSAVVSQSLRPWRVQQCERIRHLLAFDKTATAEVIRPGPGLSSSMRMAAGQGCA